MHDAGWMMTAEYGISRNGPGPCADEPYLLAVDPWSHRVVVGYRDNRRDRLSLVVPGGSPLPFAPGLCFEGESRLLSLKPGRDGFVAVVGLRRRRVLLLGADGGVLRIVYQHASAAHIGLPTCAVRAGQHLVVCEWPTRDRPGAAVSMLDARGGIVWRWAPGPDLLGEATDVTLSHDGVAVVTDSLRCRVTALDLTDGHPLWTYGARGAAASPSGHLLAPRATTAGPDGRVFVADTRNDRIVELDAAGARRHTWRSSLDAAGSRTGPLCQPLTAAPLGHRRLLIADSGNRRLVVLDEAGREQWADPPGAVPVRHLSFPRSARRIAGGAFLVADTNNNRVVELTRRNRIAWCYGGVASPPADFPLDWPRSAVRLSDGSTIVANGAGGQLLRIDAAGRVLAVLDELTGHGRAPVPLQDPHDVVAADDGTLVVVDTGPEEVLRCTAEGRLLWRYPAGADGLTDPHQVVANPAGGWLVAHAGGIGLLTRDGALAANTGRVPASGGEVTMRNLKALAVTRRRMFVSGTFDDTSGLLAVERRRDGLHATMVAALQPAPGLAGERRVNAPRSIDASHPGRLLVSDYGGHRLVEVAPPPERECEPVADAAAFLWHG